MHPPSRPHSSDLAKKFVCYRCQGGAADLPRLSASPGSQDLREVTSRLAVHKPSAKPQNEMNQA